MDQIKEMNYTGQCVKTRGGIMGLVKDHTDGIVTILSPYGITYRKIDDDVAEAWAALQEQTVLRDSTDGTLYTLYLWIIGGEVSYLLDNREGGKLAGNGYHQDLLLEKLLAGEFEMVPNVEDALDELKRFVQEVTQEHMLAVYRIRKGTHRDGVYLYKVAGYPCKYLYVSDFLADREKTKREIMGYYHKVLRLNPGVSY